MLFQSIKKTTVVIRASLSDIDQLEIIVI